MRALRFHRRIKAANKPKRQPDRHQVRQCLDRLKSLYDFKQGLDEFASFELLKRSFAPAPAKSTARFPSTFPVTGSIVDVSVGDERKGQHAFNAPRAQ